MFHTVLIRPLTNFFVILYNTAAFRDLGVAVVLFALIIKIALYPLSKKSIESQEKLQKLQPKLKELQTKYPDKEEQAKAMMQFWQENKANPFSGCLPLLIQFPIIIAIFDVFRNGLAKVPEEVLYSFVKNPGTINQSLLKIMDISQKGGWTLAVITAILQFLQIKLSAARPKGEKTASSPLGNQLLFILPIFSAMLVFKFPAVLGLYWMAFTGFSILEHIIIRKSQKQENK